MAILSSYEIIQSADKPEIFLICNIPKEYDNLTASIYLE